MERRELGMLEEPAKDFFSLYLDYVGASESPTIYHRWSVISIVGTLLGRQAWLPFGHGTIYPNQYILLMGTAGARKSSALDIAKNLLKDTGYKKFAPAKTSKERLLVEMQALSEHFDEDDDLESLVLESPSEIFVCKGEFIDFIGINDTGFMNLLTDLWDNLPDYDTPKITRKSVRVYKPTISILGGATPQAIALAIPPEQLELGFTSRILFIFAEPTGTKITLPPAPSQELKSALLERLARIQSNIKGAFSYEEGTLDILDGIYKEFHPIDDARFSRYSSRRFTHFLKLALIVAAMEERMVITKEDLIKANTILHAAELKMPKALGEFGKSRYSNVSNTIIEFLSTATKPASPADLWKLVAKDLTKVSELGDILKNLQHAGKIQVVTMKDKQGYMARTVAVSSWRTNLIDESFLQFEERN